MSWNVIASALSFIVSGSRRADLIAATLRSSQLAQQLAAAQAQDAMLLSAQSLRLALIKTLKRSGHTEGRLLGLQRWVDGLRPPI